MAAYVKVANADDLQPGQAKLVNAGDQQVALFNVGGTCYAIDDTCTHRGGPLSEEHPRGRCRHLPVARGPLLRSRWPSPRPTGSTERHVVPRAGHGRQYRNRVLKVRAPCSRS